MFGSTVPVFGRDLLLLDVGGVVAAAGLAVAFVVSATRNTVALYREEPVPEATHEPKRQETAGSLNPRVDRRRHPATSVEVLL